MEGSETVEVTGYKIVYEGGTGETEEKKSRFIATVQPVSSEQEALEFIQSMKKKYWDARHNCYAFVVGANQELQRCSDDGEPGGTAGRPMLDVLLKEGIHNAAVVVTRYFGGTLLGTGGLVRAYQKAVQEGLAGSTVAERAKGRSLDIHTDYNGVGKIQYILAAKRIEILDSQYTDQVTFRVMVPLEQTDELEKEITEATSGKSRFVWGESVEYSIINEKLKIF